MIKVNLDKAKEIAKKKIREARDPLLAALDVDFMKAIEKGQDVSAIVAKKQELRDLTKIVDSVESVDALKEKIEMVESL